MDAVALAKQYAADKTNFKVGNCWVFVRQTLGYTDPIPGYASAAQAFMRIQAAHGISNSPNPPAGAPVFWTGGTSGLGHVALSAGDGQVYSTDFGPNGYLGDGLVHLVPISVINEDTALHYQGWANTVAGTPVSTWNVDSTDTGTGLPDLNPLDWLQNHLHDAMFIVLGVVLLGIAIVKIASGVAGKVSPLSAALAA